MISSAKITRGDFDKALGRYEALIKSISDEKASKPGRGGPSSTLAELDEARFKKLPEKYSKAIARGAPQAFLSKEDLIELVSWKLKHGTFRPNLLNLAEQNSEDEVKKVTGDVFEDYDNDGAIEAAVDKLSKLKGIGPATASLILSVHDATQVVFFGDEVYLWLVGGVKKDIKYTAKEFAVLVTESKGLIKRLDVDARDVEKVGFVLVRENEDDASKSKKVTKEPALKKEKSEEEMAARKVQLQQMAANGRAERDAKRTAKDVKGAAFRARIDAAREKAKKEGTYVVKPKPVPSGRPRGRPPGSGKRDADELAGPEKRTSKRSKNV